MTDIMQRSQSGFAAALLDPSLPPPAGIVSHAAVRPVRRFGVYRNNVMVGLIGALESRFPATQRIVGEEFFKASARVFARAHPPTSPVMMTYGDEFPDFLAGFTPAADIPYLADVARIEAARTRAYHAADASPLQAHNLSAIPPESLPLLRFELHASLEIVTSPFPAVTIWAMNAGDMELAPIEDWRGEDALILRPAFDVEVRRLPPGAAAFLRSLKSGGPLGAAAQIAQDNDPGFDLSINLASLVSTGLAVRTIVS